MKEYIVTLPDEYDPDKHGWLYNGREMSIRSYNNKYERAIEALSKMDINDFEDRFGNGCRGLPVDEIIRVLLHDKDRDKVEALADEIGINKLYSIVKEMRGE